jgi:hypothetical protein
MTLREQIKAIHAKHFSPEFHAYRQDLIPTMVNDLKLKFFDDLTLGCEQYGGYVWLIDDSVEIRAVSLASGLIAACQMREDTKAAK